MKVMTFDPDNPLAVEILQEAAIAYFAACKKMVDSLEALKTFDRAVSSSTHHNEQITRRSLRQHLAGVYGSTTPKADALRTIAALHSSQPVVFFGDSAGDYEASCQAGVSFVGVVCERDNFQNVPVVKLRDFIHRAAVEHAMHQAVAQGAA